jgi:Prokaryotic Cytochrome C oxidase subunit IV
MGRYLAATHTRVWLGLLVLTLASFWLAESDGAIDRSTASPLILAIAFFKARSIAFFFMEIRGAGLALRILFEAWCLAAGGALVAIYCLA